MNPGINKNIIFYTQKYVHGYTAIPVSIKSLAIFLIAFVIRWVYCITLVGPTPWSDTKLFIDHAMALIANQDYGIPDRPPGFVYAVVIIIRLFGNENLNLVIYQVVLSALTSMLIYLVGRAVFSEFTGQMAGWLSVIYFPLVDIGRLIGSDTQFVFLFTLTAYVVSQKSIKLNYILGGILLGLSGLTRGAALIASPFIGLIGLTKMGMAKSLANRLTNISLLAIATTLSITPWVLRNWINYQSFIPVSSEGGLNFYQGAQLSFLESRSENLNDIRKILGEPSLEHYALLHPKYQGALMNYWWQLWLTNPTQHLLLRLISFADFWSPIERVRYYSLGISTIYSWGVYAIVLYFFIIGFFLTLKRRVPNSYFLVGSIMGIMTLHTLSHAEQNRYRLQIEPFIIIIAIYGLETIIKYYQTRLSKASQS